MSLKKKGGRFKAIFSELFELPPEVVLDLPRLTMAGNCQLLVENHRGVIFYGSAEIRIGISGGALIVRGENLQIGNLYAAELLIKGTIEHLEYNT